VATLAKLAATSVDHVGPAAGRASAKAAGVVVDDTAVTPQYVHSVAAERELPIIKKIAVGSLRNKLLLILPGLLVFSQFLPWLLTPLLMVGAVYLCYEGAEKISERLSGDGPHPDPAELAVEQGADLEHHMVTGAIRTDLVLSAEIMVIALGEVAEQSFLARAVILVVVAFALTVLVYGVVGLIVKMDDVGLHLTGRKRRPAQVLGHALVAGMPRLLAVLSVVGTAAMLWVGGHILLAGLHELGWQAPFQLVHHLEEMVHETVPGIGVALGWLAATAASAVVGVVVGTAAFAVLHVQRRKR
jgi:predicted DNA repair protein MutK